AGYMFLQSLEPTVQRKPPKAQDSPKLERRASRGDVPMKEVRKPSVVPVQAPKFQSVGWEAEVQELLQRISLTEESQAQVAAITAKVRAVLAPVMPGAKVDGYCGANPGTCCAFGVAVPDLEIVVLCKPQASARVDAAKFQKALIRSCTDRLVAAAFKFRRSAFRGVEPKVTLISPPEDGQAGIPFNLAVNACTPARSSAVFEACVQLDARAAQLVLLVRRWAKDRGISHAAKGHLSPYCWMLLVVYYLQDKEPVLPDLSFLTSGKPAPPAAGSDKSAGELLRGFFSFFAHFDWQTPIRVRAGGDIAPRTVEGHFAPVIEDPFERRSDLASSMHSLSLQRLTAELGRAVALCHNSLAELLEPWTPEE
ncbi:unnamed protein product, partial [Effrenium voratum]